MTRRDEVLGALHLRGFSVQIVHPTEQDMDPTSAFGLRIQAGDEVALSLAPGTSAGIATVARLQQRQPEAVIVEILDVAISGRLRAQRQPAQPAAGTTAATAWALVPARLMEGLQRVAEASGQAAGPYGAALVSECLHGVSTVPLSVSGGYFFASDDARVKTWLPDQVHEALVELADALDGSASDVVRSSVFAHLYGRLAYEQAVVAGTWRPSRRYEDMNFSESPNASSARAPKAPRTALIEQIGKSEIQLTVFMPVALRAQLWATAERAGLRVSEYLRRHLATYLLGRQVANALPLQTCR